MLMFGRVRQYIVSLVPVMMLVPVMTLLTVRALADDSISIAFINPGFEEKGFWHSVTKTMRAASNQFGFKLDVFYADRQWPKMRENAERVIGGAKKYDFLILVNEHQQAADLLVKANDARIPTVMLLNTLTNAQSKQLGGPREALEYWLGSIRPDNEIAGYEMAKSLVDGFSRHKNLKQGEVISVLSLAGDNTTPASLFRLDGLDRALSEFPQLAERRRIAVNWSGKVAYDRTALWLKTKQSLDAVWAANDPIALGAIDAIKEAGLKPGHDVQVAGLNWSTQAIKAVLAGEMTLTHGGHFLAGAWIMVMLYDYIQGRDFKEVGLNIHFPMTAIDAENAQVYLDRFGAGDWSSVDFRQFSLAHGKNTQGYEFTLQRLLSVGSPGTKAHSGGEKQSD